MFTSIDYYWMQQSLDLASLARTICQPNPRVGCVIVKDNALLGQGYTQAPGNHHAEIMALEDAKKQGYPVFGATAYVTLEPCCHYGKTPPCTDTLIKSGIRRIVIAGLDPNPLVAGKGIKTLQDAGIEIEVGLLNQKAEQENIGFMKRMRLGLPWVRLKIAASLDSITALPNGKSKWITGPLARQDGHLWRAQASVLLTGGGTVLADDPELNVRGIEIPNQPLRVIVDSHLETPLQSKILRNGKTLIAYAALSSDHSLKTQDALLNMGVELIHLPNQNGKVDLLKLLQYLATVHQANEVHVEAGSKLNGSLIRENCVDELLIYLAPKLLGQGLSITNLGPLFDIPEGPEWEWLEQKVIGPDLRLRLVKLLN